MNKFYTSDTLLEIGHIELNFEKELSLLKLIPQNINLEFEVIENRLMLKNEIGSPLFIDIEKKLNYHKTFFYKHSIYKEPLAKAIGLKKNKELPMVLDATGGLLGDTLLLKSFGLEVDVIERNPLVAALIVNAIRNCSIDFNFCHMSAFDLEKFYPVIFFDPMYEQKNSKAAPKKEMAVFRKVVGKDEDRIEVAQHLKSNCSRLVIKRSIKAKSLILNPNMTFCGKSTCYDVYLN